MLFRFVTKHARNGRTELRQLYRAMRYTCVAPKKKTTIARRWGRIHILFWVNKFYLVHFFHNNKILLVHRFQKFFDTCAVNQGHISAP